MVYDGNVAFSVGDAKGDAAVGPALDAAAVLDQSADPHPAIG